MGLEPDSYGVKNQLGHTHDIKATDEKASSLGGQRADEVVLKYGGRRCDLSTLTPGKNHRIHGEAGGRHEALAGA